MKFEKGTLNLHNQKLSGLEVRVEALEKKLNTLLESKKDKKKWAR